MKVDHDTACRFTIQPSVNLDVQIPEKYEDSWYRGKVLFNNHDIAFNPSSHFHHLLLSLQHLKIESLRKVFGFTAHLALFCNTALSVGPYLRISK
jgi:hypothetical protein